MSAVLDLANGLERDKSVLTALFACELAGDAGLGVEHQRAAFFSALLRHLGCTAYASEESRLAPDDIALRRRLIHTDTSKPRRLMAAVAGPDAGWGGRLATAVRVSLSATRLRAEWTQEACAAARLLATQLGLGPLTVQALDEVFERWDGQGGPHRLRGDAISPAGRVAMAAHVAVVFWQHGGSALAREVLGARAQQALEPRLAKLAAQLVADFDARLTPQRLAEVEQRLGEALVPLEPRVIAETFGDFADLQLPFSRGHSRRVAAVCARVGAALHLTAAEQETLKLAAHLHDLGQVAIPTGQWLRAQWSPADHERARQHVFFAAHALRQAAPLHAAAELISQHHERLDGSGYHALEATALGLSARVLSVADVSVALREDRPHRPALAEGEARQVLKSLVAAGRLDAACVAATLDEPTRPVPRDDALLTPREREVLRWVAVGQTNKQIAAALGISPRTVQHHTIHLYAKLGVDTRAGAALIAARRGWV